MSDDPIERELAEVPTHSPGRTSARELVERVMIVADAYYRSAYHDESSIERDSLRAEVERLVQELQGAYDLLHRTEDEKRAERERAEAAERDAKRYRWLRNERAVVEVGGRTASLWFDYKRASDIDDHADEAIEKDRLALDDAIDAAIVFYSGFDERGMRANIDVIEVER